MLFGMKYIIFMEYPLDFYFIPRNNFQSLFLPLEFIQIPWLDIHGYHGFCWPEILPQLYYSAT
jgi:hypothetical protein